MNRLLTILALAWTTVAQAANPAFTDFNTNEFLTTANKVFFKRMTNDVGVMSIAFDAAAIPDTSGVTNSTDVVGIGESALNAATITNAADIYGLGNQSLASAQVDGSSGIYAIGDRAGQSLTAVNGSTVLYGFGFVAMTGSIDSSLNLMALGDRAMSGVTMTNVQQATAIGDNAMSGGIFTGANGLFAFGNSALSGAIMDASASIYALGDNALLAATITAGSTEVYAFGSGALQNSVLKNVDDLVAVGKDAGTGIGLTNKSHIFLLGTGATATGSHQFIQAGYAITSIDGNGPDLTGIVNSSDVVGIGDFALHQLVTDGSLNLYGIGDSALAGTTLGGFSGQTFAFGDSALSGVVASNVVHLYGIGSSVGTGMTGDGISGVYGIGDSAFQNAVMDNTTDIYAIGTSAGQSVNLAGQQHVFMIGSNASATNSNDFVFGDNAYRYVFPGQAGFILGGTTNQITFGGTNTAPVSAVAPTKWISVQVSGMTNKFRLPLYE